MIWTTRSAAQAGALLPILIQICEEFQSHWNNVDHSMNCRLVQSVHVYVTDTNLEECEKLKAMYEYDASRCGLGLHFGRVDFEKVFENQMDYLLAGDEAFGPRITSTVCAFCGSPTLGSLLDNSIERVNWMLELSNNRHHNFVFNQENLGHTPVAGKINKNDGVTITSKSNKLNVVTPVTKLITEERRTDDKRTEII